MHRDLVAYTTAALAAAGDPARVPGMQAYLKTDMPFHGVGRAALVPILREQKRRFPAHDAATWERCVAALWDQPHREEKYAAIAYARAFRRFHQPEALALFERLIREGAWWDLVDEVAAHLSGGAWKAHRAAVTPVMREWIEDDDLWVRRAAIIGQITHKGDADADLLFDFCRRCAPERSFWIRKAIGWALRTHARTDPEAVRAFLGAMGDGLSGLSRREAAKHLSPVAGTEGTA